MGWPRDWQGNRYGEFHLKTALKGDRGLGKLREKGVDVTGICCHILGEFWTNSFCISVFVSSESAFSSAAGCCLKVHKVVGEIGGAVLYPALSQPGSGHKTSAQGRTLALESSLESLGNICLRCYRKE